MDVIISLGLDDTKKAAVAALSDDELFATSNETAGFAKYDQAGSVLIFIKFERDHSMRVYLDRRKNDELICRVSTEFGNMRKAKTYMQNAKFDAEMLARGIVDAAAKKTQRASNNGRARGETGPGPMIA